MTTTIETTVKSDVASLKTRINQENKEALEGNARHVYNTLSFSCEGAQQKIAELLEKIKEIDAVEQELDKIVVSGINHDNIYQMKIKADKFSHLYGTRRY